MTDTPKKTPRRAKGGLAVAANMTPEEKSERARKAAAARWGTKPPVAIRKGNFKDQFGFDAECYVLNDTAKTAVMSQRGMAVALGLSSSSGTALKSLVGSKAIAMSSVGAEILEKFNNPLIFKESAVVGKAIQPRPIHGHDVTLLIDICNAIVEAKKNGTLTAAQARLADHASILLIASAKAGIQGLVYALAGYRPEIEEVIQAFKAFVQEEARKYEQEFPNELYLQWHRLYNIPVPVRGKPWQMRHLTVKHIYYPLAKSNGKILELLRALKAQDGEQKKKLFQFLNEIGARALRMHIGRVLEMCESSDTAQEYDAKIIARFGGQQELDFVAPTEN